MILLIFSIIFLEYFEESLYIRIKSAKLNIIEKYHSKYKESTLLIPKNK